MRSTIPPILRYAFHDSMVSDTVGFTQVKVHIHIFLVDVESSKDCVFGRSTHRHKTACKLCSFVILTSVLHERMNKSPFFRHTD